MLNKEDIDVLLITRFNLAKKMHTKNLFDINRLKFRLEIFKNITLQSIINQTYKNFKWIILYDPLLPIEILELFKNIIKEYEEWIILELYGGWKLSCIEPYNKYLKNDYVLTIRLDDDDALSKNFINRLLNYSIKNENDFLVLSHINGIYWSYNKYFKDGFMSKKPYPFCSMGLALLINRRKFPLSVYFHDHSTLLLSLNTFTKNNKNNKIYNLLLNKNVNIELINQITQKKKYILIKNEYSFIRTFHSNNDSGIYAKYNFSTQKNRDNNIKNIINKQFNISIKSLCYINNMILKYIKIYKI